MTKKLLITTILALINNKKKKPRQSSRFFILLKIYLYFISGGNLENFQNNFQFFVDKQGKVVYIYLVSLFDRLSGVWRSLVARAVWVREAVSSSLATPTKLSCRQTWAFSSVG